MHYSQLPEHNMRAITALLARSDRRKSRCHPITMTVSKFGVVQSTSACAFSTFAQPYTIPHNFGSLELAKNHLRVRVGRF
jgi:hypothetical protein